MGLQQILLAGVFFFVVSTTGAFAKCVAITYDDGPSINVTPQILDIYAREGGRATFFVVGVNAEKAPWLLERMKASQHEVGSHMYKHKWLTRLPTKEVVEMIEKNDEVIKGAIGHEPKVLRAPFYAEDYQVWAADKKKRPFVRDDVDPRDFERKNPESIARHVISKVQDGSIVLMHDHHGQQRTVEATRHIVRTLKARGFQFVTVSEILEGSCGGIVRARVARAQ